MDDPYRLVSRVYDAVFDPMNRGLRAIGFDLLPPLPGMEVLDIGCGTGLQLERYQEGGARVHGVDPSPSMLAKARDRLGPSADLQQVDGTHLPYADDRFDVVLLTLVLHELDPPVRRAVLKEAGRVVKPEGRILIIDYHPAPRHTWKGRRTKTVITTAEILAGRRHFRNYRRYLAEGGLQPLWSEAGLVSSKRILVGGGNFAVHLLRRGREGA